MKERKGKRDFVWFAGYIGVENIHNFYNLEYFLFVFVYY